MIFEMFMIKIVNCIFGPQRSDFDPPLKKTERKNVENLQNNALPIFGRHLRHQAPS
jgi:hypothetical protein